MHLVNHRRRGRIAAGLLAVAAAAMATVGSSVARADVLEQIPADALVAVKVNNLAATSKKVGQLATDFGIAGFVPQMNNPLASLKQRLGVEKGLKEDGDLGFAFINPKVAGVDEDAAMVILVPVSNYQEFISNFEGATAEGEITEVTLPGPQRNSPRFISNWGGYAAMSPTKQLLAKPAAGLKLSALPAKEAGRQDFVLYANFSKLSPELLPKVDKLVADAMGEIEKDTDSSVDPKWKPLIKSAATQFGQVAKTFLNDSDGATIGLNISEQGMNFTVLSAFKADSYLGKMAGDLKGSDKPLTVGLPAGKYLFFGGSAFDAGVMAKVIDDLATPVLEELKKVEGGEKYSKLAESFRAATKANRGFTVGMPAPAAAGGEAIFQQVTVYHGGGQQTKTLFTEGASVMKDFITDVEVPEGQKKPEFTHSLNTKQIEGVTFDTFKFDFPASPDDPAAVQAEQMMTLFYGPEGAAYNYGTLGNDDFVLSMGAPDATIARFIKAAQAKEDSLSKLEHVKVVTDQLPKTRLLEYYISLDEIVNTGVATAGQFGMPVQVQLPPELPPIGVTVATDGPSLRIDAHVPSNTVQSIIAAAMQVFMQMQQGGGGGNL